jgi:hypothetical protein
MRSAARFVKYGIALSFACAALTTACGARAAWEWVSVRHFPAFSDIQSQLQVLVNVNGHEKTNQFCVIGQKDSHSVQAYVYWSTEQKLILWVPHLYDDEALVTSNRYLDLKRDVVDGNDVHGSTYMVTRSFVSTTLQACSDHGDKFTIQKSN